MVTTAAVPAEFGGSLRVPTRGETGERLRTAGAGGVCALLFGVQAEGAPTSRGSWARGDGCSSRVRCRGGNEADQRARLISEMEEGGGLGRQLSGSDLGRPRNEKRGRGGKRARGPRGLGQQAENRAREGEKRNFFPFYFSELSNYFQTEL
jgi:hypothetical protein